jgi:hypothetical protein
VFDDQVASDFGLGVALPLAVVDFPDFAQGRLIGRFRFFSFFDSSDANLSLIPVMLLTLTAAPRHIVICDCTEALARCLHRVDTDTLRDHLGTWHYQGW